MKDVKVLVCDPIDEVGVKMLKEAGYKVDLKTEITAADLVKTAATYDALVVRSRTKVTKEVLQAGKPRLKIVARSGVGLDNVDTEAAKVLMHPSGQQRRGTQQRRRRASPRLHAQPQP